MGTPSGTNPRSGSGPAMAGLLIRDRGRCTTSSSSAWS